LKDHLSRPVPESSTASGLAVYETLSPLLGWLECAVFALIKTISDWFQKSLILAHAINDRARFLLEHPRQSPNKHIRTAHRKAVRIGLRNLVLLFLPSASRPRGKTAMLLENAIKRIDAVPGRWVRVEQVRNIPGGLELCLGIHHDKRGKTVAAWAVKCLGVHEVKITDLNGGGIALYGSDHPAAKQYAARWSELRWPRDSNLPAVFTTLYGTHIETTDD
jgi:hypothetical protein